MPEPNALQKRVMALHDKAEKVYKAEEVEERIDRLSSMYHYGYGNPVNGSYATESSDSNRDRVVHVNKIYPRVRTAMSSLYAKRPEIVARGRRAQDTQSAQVAEVLLNYMTRHMKYSAELREWLFWARLGLYGVLKLGMEKDKSGRKLPMLRTIDPRSVRVDTNSTDRFRPDEGQWQAFKFKRTLSALRRSGIYDEKLLDTLHDKVRELGQEGMDEDTTELWVWEHHIWDGKEVAILVSVNGFDERSLDSTDRVWIREESKKSVIGLPGRFLYFVPSPKTFYPVSPIELWLDQQREINAFRTQKLEHAERSNRQWLYDVNAFDEEAKAMLESGLVRQYLPVTSPPTKGLEGALIEKPMASTSADIYQGEMEADQTITEIDGIGGVQLGRTEPERGSTSATRDTLVENSLRLRMTDNQEVWEDALEDVYQSAFNLAQAGMDGELILKITGIMEIRLSRQNIQGDIDIILTFGSTQPRDKEIDFEKAKELYTLFAGNPIVNQDRLTRYVLQKQGDIKDIDAWIVPQMPAPMPGMGLGMPGMDPGMGMGQPPPQIGEVGPMDLNQIAQEGTASGQSPLSMAAGFRGMV